MFLKLKQAIVGWINYFHIEGSYGYPCSKETYDAYINGGHGHGVCIMIKVAPIKNWHPQDKIQFFYLKEKPIEE